MSSPSAAFLNQTGRKGRQVIQNSLCLENILGGSQPKKKKKKKKKNIRAGYRLPLIVERSG
jgi:hypothetical protein